MKDEEYGLVVGQEATENVDRLSNHAETTVR